MVFGLVFYSLLHYKGSAERLREFQNKVHVVRKVDTKRKME